MPDEPASNGLAAADLTPARLELDVLVVGSGVAGLRCAIDLARAGMRVGVLTKGALGESTTSWSQGGVAAAVGEDDSPAEHLADTLKAGAGLCDVEAAGLLVAGGPAAVAALLADGARLDRDAAGTLERSREGGHATARVVHAGGAATGAEVQRTLVAAVRAAGVELLEHWQAVDLLASTGERGLVALDPGGRRALLHAGDVVLASGGYAALFATTTNPFGATGDGTAMALRAGVPVADLEFVQFHPTALAIDRWPRPLLSEALRGEGALLRDERGRRFVDELAPRDVVSRAIAAALASSGGDHVFLDATPIDRFAERFPSLAGVLAVAGLDPGADLLPVAPAAHYCCGGVLTDLDGATALPGLWAAGETACTGAQGANRLASNSLLEGLVFGARVAAAIAAAGKPGGGTPSPDRGRRGALGGWRRAGGDATEGLGGETIAVRRLPLGAAELPAGRGSADLGELRRRLQQTFSRFAGVVREARGLDEAARELDAIRAALGPPRDRAGVELANLVLTGSALLAAARTRQETRGAHTRGDYPATDDLRFRCRFSPSLRAPRPIDLAPGDDWSPR